MSFRLLVNGKRIGFGIYCWKFVCGIVLVLCFA